MDEVREFLFGVLTSPPTTACSTLVSMPKHDGGDTAASASSTSTARKSGSGRPRKRPAASGSEGKPSKKSKLGNVFNKLLKSVFIVCGKTSQNNVCLI